jgi:hypothetical protein
MQIDDGTPKRVQNMTAQGANTGPDKFLVLDKAALEFAQERAAALVGMQVTAEGMVPSPNPAMAITEATRDMLRGLVVRAFKEGLSPAQLAKEIEASAGFSEGRAMDIACSEIARAQCAGGLRTALGGGMTHKRWIINPESPTASHDECGENAKAGWIPIAASFPSGDICPPSHSRCACALVFGLNKKNAVAEEYSPESTRDIQLRGLVVRAFKEGLSPAQLAEMTHKRWIINPESPTANHDECGENAKAGWIPIAGKFPSGDIGPPNHSGCACTLVFGLNEKNAVAEKYPPDQPRVPARELGDFVADRCVVSDGAAVAAKRLYEEYACWARESEQRGTLPKREFNARLRPRFNSTKPQNLLIWHGIGLRAEPQPEDVKQASEEYKSAYYRVVKPPEG